MIIIINDDQYEAVLTVLAMIPPEHERNDEENMTAAQLNDAVDRYEYGDDLFELVCEVSE